MSKSVSVTIKSLSALLMHKFPLVPIDGLEKLSANEQAEHGAHRNPATKELIIPGVSMQRALVSGATYSKGKRNSSLQKQAAACLMVSPEYIGLGCREYVVDSRAVVIPATKGRIIRHRPRLDSWEATFYLEYDPTLLSAAQVREIVDNTGSRVGIMDFRPERKGPFGRFIVIHWSE